jgi:dipeptidyl-peptidase 4
MKQITKDEAYERALTLRERTRNLVTGDAVRPRWIDEHTFWYKSGNTNYRVDARTGAKSRHTPVAGQGEATLPAFPPNAPIRSDAAGEETEIVFVNKTNAPIVTFWVGGGEPKQYATIAPGKTFNQHTFGGHVWLVKDNTGRPLAQFVGEDAPGRAEVTGVVTRRGPRNNAPSGVSPDGKWQAFIKLYNLYVREVATKSEIALTTDGTKNHYYEGQVLWSPDSTHLIAYKTEAAQEHKVYIVESSPSDQLQPRLKTIDYLKPGDKIAHPRVVLFRMGSESATSVPIPDMLFPNPWAITDMRWELDSSHFTFQYNQRGHQVLRVLRVEARTGNVGVLVEEKSKTFIDYAGKNYLYFCANTPTLFWMSERDGWNHLYKIHAQTGKIEKQLTQGQWAVQSVLRVDEEKRQIWFSAGGMDKNQDPYYRHLCRVDFDGKNFVDLTPADGTYQVQFSPNNAYLIATYSRVDMPPITELRRATDGGLVSIVEKADATALVKTGWQYPERFVTKARDGKTDIYGVIWKPTDFDPSKKYPVIENIYAGPHGFHTPKSFAAYHGQRFLTELGYIVVQLDGMGTSGRSKAFHEVCWKNLADAGFLDRKIWIRAAAKTRPYMDVSRVGIYGGSAGGQNAMRALIDHSDLYKVAVSDCGCHDNRMDKIWWNELWMGWPLDESYVRSSNVAGAPKMQGKLLLVVGELDTNVDPASTMQVINALVKANKNFEYLIVPGAGHGACETPYGTRRRADFFRKNL